MFRAEKVKGNRNAEKSQPDDGCGKALRFSHCHEAFQLVQPANVAVALPIRIGADVGVAAFDALTKAIDGGLQGQVNQATPTDVPPYRLLVYNQIDRI
ncbi:hypothetical protein MSG_00290 [Mycobacterium shigaense]|uniref:Uncharacterized protein n=1 Tax=Mycobacterium shigaense TaxID=722731 RepID=A0A1Z4EBY5_9MYCO|nr:hypothetical protein MSG_00290 [Mycobacterium shigaense]